MANDQRPTSNNLSMPHIQAHEAMLAKEEQQGLAGEDSKSVYLTPDP